MLIITRRVGESFRMDTDNGEVVVVITRLESSGAVRIGIQAPDDVLILRSELRNKDDNRGNT